jgi:3-oxoadipate enol-lactonase
VRVTTSRNLFFQLTDLPQEVDFFRDVTRIFQDRVSKPQIFRPPEIFIQVERLTGPRQGFMGAFSQPFLNDLFNAQTHTFAVCRAYGNTLRHFGQAPEGKSRVDSEWIESLPPATTDVMNRQFAHVNGSRLSYVLEGAPGRSVVLLSHPLGANLDIWGYQVPLLRPSFQLLRLDLRGHGRSDAPPEAYRLQDLAADVAGLLDHLGILQVTFVGLSVGGMIAQVFALEHPDRVSALVLCSTGSKTEQPARENLDRRIARAEADGMASQVEGTLQNWFTPPFLASSPVTTGWVADLIRSTSVTGFVRCCRAIQELDVSARLPEIQKPTLIMPGTEDRNFTVALAEQLHGQIKGSELKPLQGAAHLGNVEQAHAFNEALLAFLNRAGTR